MLSSDLNRKRESHIVSENETALRGGSVRENETETGTTKGGGVDILQSTTEKSQLFVARVHFSNSLSVSDYIHKISIPKIQFLKNLKAKTRSFF